MYVTIKLSKEMINIIFGKMIMNFGREGMFGIGRDTHKGFQDNDNVLFEKLHSENRSVHYVVILSM